MEKALLWNILTQAMQLKLGTAKAPQTGSKASHHQISGKDGNNKQWNNRFYRSYFIWFKKQNSQWWHLDFSFLFYVNIFYKVLPSTILSFYQLSTYSFFIWCSPCHSVKFIHSKSNTVKRQLKLKKQRNLCKKMRSIAWQ